MWLMWEGPTHCELCHSEECEPCLYKETSWANCEEQNRNEYSSMVPTSIFARIPDRLPSMTFYNQNVLVKQSLLQLSQSVCQKLFYCNMNKIYTYLEKLSVRQKIINSFASVYLSAHILAEVKMSSFLLQI